MDATALRPAARGRPRPDDPEVGCADPPDETPRMQESSAMMHAFLTGNRAELIRRCKQKVIGRHPGVATGAPLDDAIPVFLDAIENMLLAEKEGGDSARMRPLSGPAAAPPDPA